MFLGDQFYGHICEPPSSINRIEIVNMSSPTILSHTVFITFQPTRELGSPLLLQKPWLAFSQLQLFSTKHFQLASSAMVCEMFKNANAFRHRRVDPWQLFQECKLAYDWSADYPTRSRCSSASNLRMLGCNRHLHHGQFVTEAGREVQGAEHNATSPKAFIWASMRSRKPSMKR